MGYEKPTCRRISFTETQQQILGYQEVMTNLWFVYIQTKSLEQRPTVSFFIDKNDFVVRTCGNDIDS